MWPRSRWTRRGSRDKSACERHEDEMREPRSLRRATRLMAVIELQNAIVAARLDRDNVMRVVIERAMALTQASGAVLELVEGDEMVYRAVTGSAAHALGTRLAR